MNFDWQAADEQSFTKWFVTHCIAKMPREVIDEISERSDKFTNVEIVVSLNGVEVDASHFIETAKRNMEYWSEDKAKAIVKNVTSAAEIDYILEAARRALLDQLQSAGIEISEDDWRGW